MPSAMQRAIVPLVAIGMTMAPFGASAEEMRAATGEDWVLSQLSAKLSPEKTPVASIRDLFLAEFARQDINGTGVNQKSAEVISRIERAQQRANALTPLLSRDLDGDGVITRDELHTYFTPQSRNWLRSGEKLLAPTPDQTRVIREGLVSEALAADANADGAISFDEMVAATEKGIKGRAQYEAIYARGLPPLLDTDQDGTITAAEFGAVVSRTIALVDSNADGVVASDERAAAAARIAEASKAISAYESERRRAAELAAKQQACGFPVAPPEARVILLSTSEGRALSNVALGSDGRLVTAIHVDIEEGEQPLYIVATSAQPVIWFFTGATKRVVRVVATSGQGSRGEDDPHIGTVGVAPERVHFGKSARCNVLVFEPKGVGAIQARALLKSLIGRRVDDVIADKAIAQVSLPSGALATNKRFPSTQILPKASSGSPMWEEMLRQYPAGLADIEVQSVHSSRPAAVYRVLPRAAGLAQLLDDGALEVIGHTRLRRFGSLTVQGEAEVRGADPSLEVVVPSEFRILRKIQMPGELVGFRQIRFLLARGVPPPYGPTTGTCLISEETGLPMTTLCPPVPGR